MEAIWITIAFVLGLFFRQLGLPPLIGYLVAGFGLNSFGLQGGQALEHIAHLGVLLLLFAVGLKLRLNNILRPEVWGTALLHLLVSAGLLGLAIHWMGGLAWQTAGILAITLGFSSTVMAAKVLEQKRELRAFHGRIAIGVLIFQDLVAVALLSWTSGATPSPFALLVLGLPLLRPVVHWLLDFSGHDELLLLFGLLLALVIGSQGFEAVGLSSELGALLMGVLLANHRRASELAHALWGIKELLLIGFFLQIGMAGLPSWEGLGFSLLLAVLLPFKAALFFFILVRFKLRARTAFLTGLSLATYSEFALIVASLAVKQNLLDAHWLVWLAMAVSVSFVVAAPLNRWAHSLYEHWEPYLSPYELHERHPDEQPLALGGASILIMGMGRVGVGAYDFLTQRHERVVGLDSDPDRVARHLKEGRRVLYADSEDPFFWQHLNVSKLRVIMLAMPDPEAKKIAITQLRRRGYEGLISTTVIFNEETAPILDAGGDLTFNHYDEAGVGFAERTWELLYPETADT
ncbi:MAG: cation:proton antiporter [Gammaproteobacteria bacterium]|nr:cation:proton antiporter [Gammaproteobacteria bacterium]MCP5459414.1 cation:proton antiporter [Gammaproteobacteria bacterium]